MTLFFLSACTSIRNQDNQEASRMSADSLAQAPDSAAKTLKVYTLPAPLQVATAVRSCDLPYTDRMLVPTNKSVVNYPTNYLKALNLGVSGIDMGYATIYEQKQTALYYLSRIQKLTEELGIAGTFNVSTVRRFKENISNQDSLYFIILQSFNDLHKYLHENDRTSMGLLVLTGSFVEGLYLSSSFARNSKDERMMNLVGQQKVFLGNLVELLQNQKDQKEIAELMNQLKDLQKSFSKGTDTPKISGEQAAEIATKITAIRSKIVS